MYIVPPPVHGGPPELTGGWPGRFKRQDVACGGAVVSTGWRRAPLAGGPTVRVAIVGSRGTKRPRGTRAGSSLEGKTPAGLVEKFLRIVHGCPFLFACTAQLA